MAPLGQPLMPLTPRGTVATKSPASMDEILRKMEAAASKVQQFQGSRVKLPRAEMEFLQVVEQARDFMSSILKDREVLRNIFCETPRAGHLRTILSSVKFAGERASDGRVPECIKTLVSVEQLVLEKEETDECIERAMQLALDRERRALRENRPNVRQEEMNAARRAILAVENKKLRRLKRIDPVPKIIAVEDPSLLAEMEPNKRKNLQWWMIWMVHRAHLNDPTLTVLDFSNVQMPSPTHSHGDPNTKLVAPKLVLAMAQNTHITHLNLSYSNLEGKEGRILGNALRENVTLSILDVCSNLLAPADLEVLFTGAGESVSLTELRCNNQLMADAGRGNNPALAALFLAVKTNTKLFRIGMHITEPHYLNEISRQLMVNRDVVRRARKMTLEALEEEESRREEELRVSAEAEIVEESSSQDSSSVSTAEAEDDHDYEDEDDHDFDVEELFHEMTGRREAEQAVHLSSGCADVDVFAKKLVHQTIVRAVQVVCA